MNIVIIGHGGHSKVVSDIILATEGIQVLGYLDHKYKTKEVINNFICAPISEVREIKENNDDVRFVMAIGDNRVRKEIIETLDLSSDDFISLLHPTASISSSAKIGYGTVVMPNAVINADAVIGCHSIINSAAIVEHDCYLGDFVHLCPNSTLAGAVKVESGCMIGSGATIIPNKTIGEWTVVGAGATVIDHLPRNSKAVGTPARIIENHYIKTG
ncbi:acetyltransferase [Bacillus pinisoli]|uniref:acetyltransferase n=1 Tax=Bacillus pinisoli TaxID=2901866 RepID=UPI001FF1F19C|nr:acetyltransferase [Bacillus pinisoli]